MLTRLHNKIMMFDQIRAADDYDDFLAQPKPSKSIQN
jgi:hypothetical protein